MSALIVVGLALLAVVGPGLGVAAAQEMVKVGDLGIVGDGPIYIGVEKGYFKDRGIAVKLEKFPSAATAMAPLSTGEIHVVGGGISPALFNGVARGMPIKIVAARARDIDANSVDVLMIRADLKDDVRRIGDLKGRRIAVNAAGSPLTYMVARMLESDGLTLKDVELVSMPWPDMGTAFANKAIDAGAIVDPFTAQFEDRKVATLLRRASDVVRNPWFEVSVLLYNAEWAKKSPKVAGDFAVAYLRAARELHDAMYGGKNRAEIVDILTRNTRVKDKALYDRMHWGHIDPNGVVGRESIKEQQEWWVRQGTVTRRVDVDDLVDESFVRYAVEQLGPHRGR